MHANFRRGVTIAAFAVLLTTSVAAQPARLPPSEIQTTFFNGQPFTASTLSNVKYKMTFLADGKMKREPIGFPIVPVPIDTSTVRGSAALAGVIISKASLSRAPVGMQVPPTP